MPTGSSCGQFLGDPAFSSQITRSVNYANAAIQMQPATSALFAALPSLLTANGASNPLAFAQLTPEAYASATQMGVDQTLSLTDVARRPGIATTDREDVGVFTFAQGVAQWHTLGADRDVGNAKARSSGFGFLGGIGIGNRDCRPVRSRAISTAASGSPHLGPRPVPMVSSPVCMAAMPRATFRSVR